MLGYVLDDIFIQHRSPSGHPERPARAEAVRDPHTHEVHAVITVDFDVTALSAFLSRASISGATTLLHTRDGTVLAYPNGEA